MGFSLIVGTIFIVVGIFGWLNYCLLSRRLVFYRRPAVRITYMLITAAAVIVAFFSRIYRPSSLNPADELYYWLLYAAIAWLCGQVILIILQFMLGIVDKSLGRNTERKPDGSGVPGARITRRAFLHGAAVVLPMVSVGVGARGIYEAQATMEVNEHHLTFPGLPASLQGFKIGQVSDTHLGPYFSLERLDTVVELLRQHKPDLVVITGDFADDLNFLAPALARLDQLHAGIPHGIYFCMGNHEYIRDVDLFRRELGRSKSILLENSHALILPGARPFYLLGVDYPGSERSHSSVDISESLRRRCFQAANQNLPEAAFKVLLAHHPDFFLDSFAAGIPLALAGHTHGGQVVIGGRSLVGSYSYMRGLYQENGVYGYVNSGAGHWFPFRMGCPPEISMFTLQT